MGKGRKPRRHFVLQQPYRETADNVYSSIQRNFLTDIGALEENRRVRALQTLSSIYYTNHDNHEALSKLASLDILSKVCIRLLDSSISVRCEAVKTVRNLCLCQEDSVLKAVFETGIYRTIVTLFVDSATALASTEYIELLLETLCNFVSGYEIGSKEFVSLYQPLQLCASIASQDHLPISLRSVAANFLLISTDCNKEISLQLCRERKHLDEIFDIVNRNLSTISTSADQLETKLFCLRCCGILINVYASREDFSNDILTICHMIQVVDILHISILPDLENIRSMIAASAPIDPVFRMDENLKHQDASMEDDSEQFLGTNGENEIVPDQQISHEAASNPNKLSSLDVIKLAAELVSTLSSTLETSHASNEDNIGDDEDDTCIEENISISTVHQNNLARVISERNFLSRVAEAISMISQPLLEITANVQTHGLSVSFLDILEAVDTLASTGTNLLLSGCVHGETEAAASVQVFADLLNFMFDTVDNTTKSVDNEGNRHSMWQIHSSISYSQLIRLVLSTAASSCRAFTSICKYVTFSDEQLQLKAVLLMKGISSPITEVCIASIEAVSILSESSKLTVNVNGVLTNAIIRRMTEPGSFSFSMKKVTNLPETFIIDAAIMALIDLHSSDDLNIFQNYKRFEVRTHLATSLQVLSSNLKTCSSSLSRMEKRKIKETQLNGEQFLIYKDNFANTLI